MPSKSRRARASGGRSGRAGGAGTADTVRDPIGNAARASLVTPAIDPGSILNLVAREERAKEPAGTGPSNEGDPHWLIGGPRRGVGEGYDETSKAPFALHSRIEGKQNVIGGRWADTYQGQRVNERAGAGVNHKDNFAGGGGERAKAEGGSRWQVDEYGYPMIGHPAPTGSDSAPAGRETKPSAGYEPGVVGTLWDYAIQAWLNYVNSYERPDGDVGGEWAPVGPGRGGEAPVVDRGKAGGIGDGRGLGGGPATDGPVMQSEKSILAEIMKAGGKKAEDEGTDVSYEAALAQSFHTDPKRD